MIKKAVSIILCVFLLIALTIPSFAAMPVDTDYDFSITTATNEHGQVTKTYVKSAQPSKSSTYSRQFSLEDTSYSETKSLLSALDMDNRTLENMSDSELEHYSNANTIISTVSYLKTTPDGVTSYVDKETALTESLKINQSQVRATPPSSYEDIVAEKTITDSYMILTYVLSWVSSDIYHHSVTAAWLTMPSLSFTDSLGTCTQEHTVIPNSCEGTISYDCATLIDGVQTNLVHRADALSGFRAPTDESTNWGGAAVVFDVPSSRQSPEYSTIYSGVVVNFKVNTRPTYPTLESYFLSTATYSHTVLYLGIEEVDISSSGGVSVTSLVGIGDELRTVCFDTPIHHIP